MVKLYIGERFSKKNLPQKIAEEALKLFDGPGTFARSKVIHATSCYLNKHD